MNQASLEGLHMDVVSVVSGCVPLHPMTPSEVRALTVAPSSPALASASALFTGLKEPYIRTTLGMFHSSLNIPFLEQPNVLEDLSQQHLPLMLLGRMSLGRRKRPLIAHPSFQSGEVKPSLLQGWRMVFLSLWAGIRVSQGMKRSSQV